MRMMDSKSLMTRKYILRLICCREYNGGGFDTMQEFCLHLVFVLYMCLVIIYNPIIIENYTVNNSKNKVVYFLQ